ncbi:hypothetical protein NLU13_7652 [Sarocladium strictum]|uniref:Peroxin 20 n=1 Tax=Sarocladium strictum TaxID=5046 RepID=A0AA39L609_SARSR|nr:hypothetical protein NLU13_7652 [Sarocladium strictum]
MAEASCSGTTAFKRIVDHQSRDVSHHQDRLVGQPHAGSQGAFRSAAAPAQHVQDNFAAFMDGNNGLPGMPHDPAGRLAAHAAALDPLNHPRMSTPGIIQPQQQHSGQSTPDIAGWAADFNRFNQKRAPLAPLQNGMLPAQQQQMQQPAQFQGFQAAFGSVAPLYGPTNGGFMDPVAAAAQRPVAEADFDQEMTRWMAANGGGDMTDVDAAMDQMARELELNEAALREAEQAAERESHLEAQSVQEAQYQQEALETRLTDLDTPEIANLSIDDRHALEEESRAQQAAKERSAVAEAAEQLLDTVQHEQGEKWQNSVFLSLMRDFRDGRKDIIDGTIQVRSGTQSPAVSEGGTLVTDFRKIHDPQWERPGNLDPSDKA